MDWPAAYRAYDDDTLVALASAGLLRRAAKDVEAGKVGWSPPGGATSTIEADGQPVELDARGPQHARCSCPAPGLCKHILAAVLWLRTLPATPPAPPPAPAASPAGPVGPDSLAAAAPAGVPGPSPVPAAEVPGATPDPLAEVLALDSAALFKAAGVTATRQAAKTPGAGLEWRVQGATLVIELAGLGVTCRWVAGAGFGGMVSEVAAGQRKVVHLMALAALRAALGQPLAWPPGLAPEAAGGPEPATLTPGERAFLGQVRSTLHELLHTGLSHASALVGSRLLALNMSARSEGLPRLAALLRNLGGMVELLVRHDHQAQERDALALMSRIGALCEALLACSEGRDPALLPALRGALRRSFDETGELELLPLGAHWWQTLGGARGLSLALWDVHGARLLQAGMARPDASDPAFTRLGAWSAQAFWPGAGTAAQMAASPLLLSQPRLAEDGRLALGGTSRARSLPAWQAADPRLGTLGCDDWSVLAAHLRSLSGLNASTGDVLLLRPARTRAPVLNEVWQQLRWAVQDGQGRWLELVLPLGPQHDTRAQNLERFVARGAPLHAVVVRVEQSHASTHLVPFAALSSHADGLVHAVSFDFASEPARPTPLAQHILRLLQQRKDQAPASAPPTLTGRLLQPVLQVLEAQAATGRMALTPAQRDQLCAAAPPIASVGWHTLGRALEAHMRRPGPDTLLRLHRLGLWMLELDGLAPT
jgi:hypothetical protein